MTRRTGLVDLTVLTLQQHIRSGQWPVGSRIPPEPDLVEMLGVGRNTVREAVQALVHAGMLARRQGSGTYVISVSELEVAISRHLADAHHRDVLEVRRGLEVEAARLAAERRTDEDVATLRARLAERVEATLNGDIEAMVRTDLALHRAVAQISRNSVLMGLYSTLLGAIRENIRLNFELPMSGDESHAELVEAIADGDANRAALAVRDYLVELLREA